MDFGGREMKILKIVFVLLLVGACSACTTLPDIKPFADATAALGAAVKATRLLLMR